MMVPPTLSTMASKMMMRNASILNNLLLSVLVLELRFQDHSFLSGTRFSHLKSDTPHDLSPQTTGRCAYRKAALGCRATLVMGRRSGLPCQLSRQQGEI